MATVLVLTGRSDITADAVVDELTKRRAKVVRYDTADFPIASKVAVTLGSQGWQGTLTGDHPIELESISSVWWRRPGEFSIPTEWPDEARAFAASEGRVGVLGVLGSLPARWINHPSRDSAANYKPVQLAVAARAGLDVPRTVITSDLTHGREFIGSDEVIYKGLSGGVLTPDLYHRYIPTTLLRADDVDEGLAGTAHLFQERVPKAFEVRLTVIGDRMFPVAIHTDTEAGKLDWRTDYASLRYQPVEMPVDIEKGVRQLMDEMGLFFGALDFAVTPDGQWVFFEVNPNGQWHWLAVKAGVPMVEAMADALQRKDQ
ncbi:ATP-grasp ribosomal peptide maturase [Kribbella albertanoniae]|uniref:ATP-grasp ribosomal peptide maturase n=1 Tax=Kribbella albertanoniae TaxID=1266829 RepID=A0A4R4PVN8_9ACTN|nr:ATP-grasp ribosomal peptide maturase [Kribbella albertanoniae]TDC26541.1 ATP-grasp ribosomal peptide maturase [Kribbella albertanoniae]